MFKANVLLQLVKGRSLAQSVSAPAQHNESLTNAVATNLSPAPAGFLTSHTWEILPGIGPC